MTKYKIRHQESDSEFIEENPTEEMLDHWSQSGCDIIELDNNQLNKKEVINKMAENIDYSKVGPVQSISVDLGKYDKQVVELTEVEVTQVPSIYTPLIPGTQQHYFQWVLKVSSNILETIREGEDKIEFKASELFSLIQDDKGNLKGFPTGEASKLQKFLKDLKVPDSDKLQNLDEVIKSIKGKKAVVKAIEKDVEGKKRTYLAFRY